MGCIDRLRSQTKDNIVVPVPEETLDPKRPRSHFELISIMHSLTKTAKPKEVLSTMTSVIMAISEIETGKSELLDLSKEMEEEATILSDNGFLYAFDRDPIDLRSTADYRNEAAEVRKG